MMRKGVTTVREGEAKGGNRKRGEQRGRKVERECV